MIRPRLYRPPSRAECRAARLRGVAPEGSPTVSRRPAQRTPRALGLELSVGGSVLMQLPQGLELLPPRACPLRLHVGLRAARPGRRDLVRRQLSVVGALDRPVGRRPRASKMNPARARRELPAELEPTRRSRSRFFVRLDPRPVTGSSARAAARPRLLRRDRPPLSGHRASPSNGQVIARPTKLTGA